MTTKLVASLACVVALGAAVMLAAEPLAGLPIGHALRAQVVERYTPEMVKSWRPLQLISSELQQAVVLWEDPDFYDHSGLSYGAILVALSADVRERRYSRGGSTITQQVAKNLFLTRDKTLRRKLQDALLARRLEKVLSKEEILEVYLNSAEWGDHVYGAEAAARFYFDVPAVQLDWSQSALLAAILQNPHRFSPCVAPVEAQRRRDVVLHRLREENRITAAQYEAALSTPLHALCR